MTYFIYLITCETNDKSYVGFCSRSVKVRWRNHCYAAKTGEDSALYRAMRKHGREKFHVTVIWSGIISLVAVKELEKYYIQSFNTRSPSGYNLTIGGDHVEHSAKHCEALAERNRNRVWTPEMRKKASESARIRDKRIGWKHSEETKRKIGAKSAISLLGNQRLLGKRWSFSPEKRRELAKKKAETRRANLCALLSVQI